MAQTAKPEIVIGVVGPVGSKMGLVCDALRDALARFRYDTKVVRLSEMLRGLGPYRDLVVEPRDDFLLSHIEAGDDLCRRAGPDAMALLATVAIRNLREAAGDVAAELTNTAIVIRQIKRRGEVKALRRVYRDRFYLVAAHTPKSARLATLRREISDSRNERDDSLFESKAREIIQRDESEALLGIDHGQDVVNTFPQADFFMDARTSITLQRDAQRVVDLIFGHPFQTPTIEEYGMALAHSAARRSADLARQVGAAILDAHGSVLALGTNEVPRAGGGAYWPHHDPDGRDWVSGIDESYRRRTYMMADVLRRLKANGWLSDSIEDGADIERLVHEALEGESDFLRDSLVMDVIEFGRPVHAEMLAITDAARRGVSLDKSRMFVTTFPCHNCSRHIVSSGITEVRYIDPYPKSASEALFSDSIAVDPDDRVDEKVAFLPFIGVGPRMYMSLFEADTRKTRTGNAVPWNPSAALPRLVVPGDTHIGLEELATNDLQSVLEAMEEESSAGQEDSRMDHSPGGGREEIH